MVVGAWLHSPFGRFADVMVETAEGERVLLAPTAEIAEFVATTYRFDRTQLGEVTAEVSDEEFIVTATDLALTGRLGGPGPFDWLLRLVPSRLAAAPAWLRIVDPAAARLVPGVRTAGSAGNGRREYYGVRRTRLIDSVDGTYRGTPLGGVAALEPPVRFGFSSAPSTPQVVSVTTTIDVP
jgi:hypothetical protein